MLSRVRYTFRETFDSFRRNATLTVAASFPPRPQPSITALPVDADVSAQEELELQLHVDLADILGEELDTALADD